MFRVVLYPQARRDAEEILSWLNQRSPQGANRWYNRYLEMLQLLSERAAGCSLAPEAHKLNREVRQCLFKTRRGRVYRSLFVLKEDTVHVLAVRGAGEDLVAFEDLDPIQ